jgi:hypothetical protein
MGKYDPLRDCLRVAPDEIEWSFDDVSDLVGGLPASARDHPAWWGNEHTHVQSAAWLSAGYKVESVNLVLGRVLFRRIHRE